MPQSTSTGVVVNESTENGTAVAGHLRTLIPAYDRAADWLLTSFEANKGRGSSAWESRALHPLRGWAYPYPETTGYILPTLYDCLSWRASRFDTRVQRAIDRSVEWLLSLQMPSGAFPAGHVSPSGHCYLTTADYLRRRKGPLQESAFNSGQILRGLSRHFRETGSSETGAAVERCADFLKRAVTADGRWSRDAYAGSQSPAYFAYVSGALAEYGALAGDREALACARLTTEAIAADVDAASGFIPRMGFGGSDEASTHTIGYTLHGLLECDRLVEDGAVIHGVARRAIDVVFRRSEVRKRMPGAFGPGWRADWSFVCLTGSFQLALCFVELYRRERDPRYLNAACRQFEMGRSSQASRGAFAGSSPGYGPYMRFRYPNWAAKYFMDLAFALATELSAEVPA